MFLLYSWSNKCRRDFFQKQTSELRLCLFHAVATWRQHSSTNVFSLEYVLESLQKLAKKTKSKDRHVAHFTLCAVSAKCWALFLISPVFSSTRPSLSPRSFSAWLAFCTALLTLSAASCRRLFPTHTSGETRQENTSTECVQAVMPCQKVVLITEITYFREICVNWM